MNAVDRAILVELTQHVEKAWGGTWQYLDPTSMYQTRRFADTESAVVYSVGTGVTVRAHNQCVPMEDGAKLVAYAHNALPMLLRTIREQQARIEELEFVLADDDAK